MIAIVADTSMVCKTNEEIAEIAQEFADNQSMAAIADIVVKADMVVFYTQTRSLNVEVADQFALRFGRMLEV